VQREYRTHRLGSDLPFAAQSTNVRSGPFATFDNKGGNQTFAAGRIDVR
jgi:hypothetical protein